VIPMVFSDRDLIQMHVEALFVHDTNGKLLRINEPDPTSPAPRFFLVRAAAGHLWRTRCDLPPDLSAGLGQLAASEPISGNLFELPRYGAEYMALLQPYTPLIAVDSEFDYYLPEMDAPRDVVTITAENRSLVQTHFDWLYETFADYAPVVAAVVDGNAVAVCFCSRITPQVAEAGAYTQADYRGHGYATSVVQGWAVAVRSTGRLPLYGTSWSNHASQAIARKLGAVLYAVDYSLT